jgi:putative solute:sodium symporter small subunit
MSEPRQPAPPGRDLGATGRPWRTFAAVAVAAFLGLGVPAFVQTLNFVKAGGFPLGFYLAAQGIPVVLAILLFLHARRANRIEREGAGEQPVHGRSRGRDET